MHVQIQALEMIQVVHELEYSAAQRPANFKRACSAVFIQLANFVTRSIRVLPDFNFDKLRRAGLENSPVRKYRAGGSGAPRFLQQARKGKQTEQYAHEDFHCLGWMLAGRCDVAWA